MNNRKWVESTILGIIVLNILVLAFVFLIPRVQFMVDHWGWEAEALMESSGARDTPNQYSKTYRMVNQVKKVLLKNSIILMPPDNWEFGSSRSVVIQRLYPNKVYFAGDKDFSFQIKIIDIKTFFNICIQYIDHSIEHNKREDGLYHSYNLVSFCNDKISIRNLYEMLEGQVAILSSGFLSSNDSLELLDALKSSKMFRPDQYSYMLYPDRQLPRFLEKNNIPKEMVNKSELLKKLKITKQSLNRVLKDLIKLEIITFKKGDQDTRVKHVFLNDKGKKIFNEIFELQKKRVYGALLNSSSEEVINFDNVLSKIING